MTSIAFNALAVNNAEQFRESVSELAPNTCIFLTYGHTEAWANDNLPPVPNTSINSINEVWKKMIGGKRITAADIRHVIQRNNWTSNTKYAAYDHTNENLYDEDNRFYVVTGDFNVYKCISNANSSVSMVEPSYVNSFMGPKESDGYIWKYMYTINSGDQINYLTTEYIPVDTLSLNNGSIQWYVQDDAVDGGIHSIVVTNPGSNYSNQSNLIVTISGDGDSLTAYANVSSLGGVSNVTITNPGAGYSFADVTISGGGGSGAIAKAIISPPGGHGKDALYELGGSRVIISVKIKGTENDILPASNDLRQIALIKDPYLRDTTQIATNTAFFQGQTITTTGSGNYIQNEFVYQGTSLASATYKARVLEWDSATGNLKVVESVGIPSTASLIGDNSSVTRFVVSVNDKEFQPYSGKVLYMDNIEPITRATDQTENYKIVLKF